MKMTAVGGRQLRTRITSGRETGPRTSLIDGKSNDLSHLRSRHDGER